MSAWRDEEPDDRLAPEARYLLGRAASRPLPALALAIAVTLAVVTTHALMPRRFASTVVLCATEGSLDESSAPRQSRALAAYVESVLFSSERLLEVIRRHDLYPLQRALGPDRALEAFRDNLHVEVWRNEFLVERESVNDPARSTRLSLTFTAADPELAFAVAQDLARVLVASAEERRTSDSTRNAAALAHALAERKDDLRQRREALARSQIELSVKPSPERAVVLAGEEAGLARQEQALTELAAQQAKVALRVRIEERAMGLGFDVVDAGRPERARLSQGAELVILGATTFVLLLPLALLVLAAFDARLYRAEDLRRLGIAPIGVM